MYVYPPLAPLVQVLASLPLFPAAVVFDQVLPVFNAKNKVSFDIRVEDLDESREMVNYI